MWTWFETGTWNRETIMTHNVILCGDEIGEVQDKEMFLLNQSCQMTDLWCRKGPLHATTRIASICRDEPIQHLMLDASCPAVTHAKRVGCGWFNNYNFCLLIVCNKYNSCSKCYSSHVAYKQCICFENRWRFRKWLKPLCVLVVQWFSGSIQLISVYMCKNDIGKPWAYVIETSAPAAKVALRVAAATIAPTCFIIFFLGPTSTTQVKSKVWIHYQSFLISRM